MKFKDGFRWRQVQVLILVGVGTFWGAVAFYYLGRGVWHPVYQKWRGLRTEKEVVEVLRPEVEKRLEAVEITSELWEAVEGLILVGLKAERLLEVYGELGDGRMVLLKRYPFTGFSGRLGPKLREGDGQIPEGIYGIEYLNPNSRYHLSMKISYPNAFDREKGRLDGRERLGYDIFIHGKSATIGCIPIGDEAIEELFLMVSEMGKEHVRVIISPYDMCMEKWEVEVEGIDWEGELYDEIREALGEVDERSSM